MNNLANVYLDQGKLEEARKLKEQVLENRRRVLGDEHPDTLNSMNSLGWLFLQQGKLEEARKLYEEVLENRRRVLGDEHPHTLRSMNQLAWTLAIDPDQTLADADRAAQLASDVVELMPEDANCRNTLGLAHYRAGNWAEVIAALQKWKRSRYGLI